MKEESQRLRVEGQKMKDERREQGEGRKVFTAKCVTERNLSTGSGFAFRSRQIWKARRSF
jgi:hypothetical protein